MSKKVKWLIGLLAIVGVSSFAWFSLKPGGRGLFVEKEISIEQATVPGAGNQVYEDWAGFRFEYPDSLTIEEVELDDKTVYSSLELTAFDGQKMSLRIADTNYKEIKDWQEEFEKDNVSIDLTSAYWVDMEGVQLSYGIPKKQLTVAIDDGIIYWLESPADEGGFWEQTHQLVLNSFEFDESVWIEPETEKAAVTAGGDKSDEEVDEDIVLIEEEVFGEE